MARLGAASGCCHGRSAFRGTREHRLRELPDQGELPGTRCPEGGPFDDAQVPVSLLTHRSAAANRRASCDFRAARPSGVVAGAGAGKTETMAVRVVVEPNGFAKPEQVLS